MADTPPFAPVDIRPMSAPDQASPADLAAIQAALQTPGGSYTVPGQLPQTAYDRLLAQIQSMQTQQGQINAQQIADEAALQQKLKAASAGRTQNDLAADLLRTRADALKKLGIAEADIPMLKAPVYEQPEIPPLVLPNAPTPTQPHANGLATLAAGILGIVDPQAAGQFMSSALDGSIEANERQKADNQRLFENQTRIAQAKHLDDIQRADRKLEIDRLNKEGQARYSIEEFQRKLESAQRASQEGELREEADVRTKFEKETAPARVAAIEAEGLKEKLDRELKQSEALTRSVGTLSENAARIEEREAAAKEAAAGRAAALKEKTEHDKTVAAERERHDKAIEQERHQRDVDYKAIQTEANNIRRAHGGGRGGSMIHETPEERHARIEFESNQRIYEFAQKQSMAPSAGDTANQAGRNEAAQSALEAVRGSYERWRSEANNNPARRGGAPSPAPGVHPPKGARVLKFDKNGNPVP